MSKHERLWLAVMVFNVVALYAQPEGLSWRTAMYGLCGAVAFLLFVKGEHKP